MFPFCSHMAGSPGDTDVQGQEHPWAPWEAEEEAGMVGGSQAEGSSPGPQEGGIC